MPEKTGQQLVNEYVANPSDKNRDLALCGYKSLINDILGTFETGGCIDFTDLLQIAQISLQESLLRYEAGRNLQFSTYATYFIKGKIRNYLRDHASMIRMPAWLHELSRQIRCAEAHLERINGSFPDVKTVAAHLKISEREVENFYKAFQTQRVVSTSAFEKETNDSCGSIALQNMGYVDPGFEAFEQKTYLTTALNKLTEDERLLLHFIYEEEMAISDVAVLLDLTRQGTHYRHRAILLKLRKTLGD